MTPTVNYDHVLIVPNADGKDGSKAVANLMEERVGRRQS